jgi:hypothetical protein
MATRCPVDMKRPSLSPGSNMSRHSTTDPSPTPPARSNREPYPLLDADLQEARPLDDPRWAGKGVVLGGA